MGMSYDQAKAYGIGHLHPASSGARVAIPPAIAAAIAAAKPIQPTKPAPPKAPGDGLKLNKGLERPFYEAALSAQRGGDIRRVRVHPIKLKVIGPKYYIPDFLIDELDGSATIVETKGRMREDAELKLIAAAEHYPMFRWVLVKRIGRKWQCQDVTAAEGISKVIWRLEWLY